ncbi:helix-turn-helix domain-containing protein [Brevundimonas diminuta]|uniref:HTH araC/xylS-type domain-containing protein n=1 Tax=Brevundimonas diminuta TaxID=293 RepID=A0A1Z3LVP5_BREDI|nr:AraC family transcriptional regulator [Brevundimonas diminuta]ASD26219.1 hypothetical protein CD943_04535 [Brevundimonas diminuta]
MSSASPARPSRLTATIETVAPGTHVVPATSKHRLTLYLKPATLAELAVGGERREDAEVLAGDLDFLPVDLTGLRRSRDTLTVLSMELCPSLFSEAASRLARSSRGLRLRPLVGHCDQRLASLAALAPAMIRDEPDKSPAFIDAVGVALAVRLLETATLTASRPERVRPLEGRRLRKVLGYIETHLDQQLTLDDLAAQAGLRRSHFAAAFRLAMDASPRQFILRRRVEAAQALLGRGEMSISEVAYQTGFAHQSHLSRMVRRMTGQTPRELCNDPRAPAGL